jgi:hypothetical protein
MEETRTFCFSPSNFVCSFFLGHHLFAKKHPRTSQFKKKTIMVATGSKMKKMDPRIVEDGSPSVATHSRSIRGKKATSLAQQKPRISLNFNGQH